MKKQPATCEETLAIRAGKRRRLLSSLTHVFFLSLLLILWQTASLSSKQLATALPPITDVGLRLGEDFTSIQILQPFFTTAKQAVLGLLLACLISLPLAYSMFKLKFLNILLLPYIRATQAVPIIAVAPILALWIGYGTLPIVLLCSIVAFFPIFLSTFAALNAIPKGVYTLAKIDKAKPLQILFLLEIPLAFKQIMYGVKSACPLAITGSIIGEINIGAEGMAEVLNVYRNTADSVGIFSVVALFLIMAYSLILFVKLLQMLGQKTVFKNMYT